MSESILSAKYLQDEQAAYKFVEERIWPNGAVCPHCGVIGGHYELKGKTTRAGLWKCKDCRKPFTVKIGTIFQSSHIKLHLWLQAIFLIASSKKGISSNQLHRTLGITLKSAWFLSHRIREAMKEGGLDTFGSGGGEVEIDETFIGQNKEKGKDARGYAHKNKVLSLVDRSTGRARSVVVDNLKLKTLLPIIQANVSPMARVMTDEAKQYQRIGQFFADHGSTIHSIGRYVDYNDKTIHTNTVEGFFSIFKRGMKGVYQHCAHNHLNRYLAEFDFRYSNRAANGVNDTERAEKLLQGVKGKRLTYETTR
ncbi:MAG: IS1595 family transposase [Burkholderiales bacterium]|nr:IS1595 family transposase [Burkholderiales bacterium]